MQRKYAWLALGAGALAVVVMVLPTWPMRWMASDDASVVSTHSWYEPILFGYLILGAPIGLIAGLLGLAACAVGIWRRHLSAMVPVAFGIGALAPALQILLVDYLYSSQPEASYVRWFAPVLLAVAAILVAVGRRRGRMSSVD